MKNNTLEDSVRGLLNYLWPRSEKSQELIDISVRVLVEKRILSTIKTDRTLEFFSSKTLLEYYERNEEFRLKVHSAMENIFTEFNEFVDKFGGTNYLFVLTLLHIDFADAKLNDAKNNIINWYFDDFHLNIGRLKGNIQSAWFPFDEFSSIFSNIATNLLSSFLYDGGKSIIYKILSVCKGINLLPQSIIDASETQELDIIKEKLGTTYREKLFIFELTKEQVDMIEIECLYSMELLLNSYSLNEVETIHGILTKESLANSSKNFLALRNKGLVKNIEMRKGIIKHKLFDLFSETL